MRRPQESNTSLGLPFAVFVSVMVGSPVKIAMASGAASPAIDPMYRCVNDVTIYTQEGSKHKLLVSLCI